MNASLHHLHEKNISKNILWDLAKAKATHPLIRCNSNDLDLNNNGLSRQYVFPKKSIEE